MTGPYGLRVWDGSGTLMLEVVDRLTKYVGTYSYTFDPFGDPTPKVITVPGVDTSGNYFVVGNGGMASFVVGSGVVYAYCFGFVSSQSDTFTVFHM